MAKAVFTHADGSIYDDLPEQRYHFPQTYLRAAQAALGDWIVYYEPRRVEAGSDRTGGRQAYFATAKLNKIEQDIAHEGYFYGLISDYLAFPLSVPFRENDNYHESLLQRGDGKTNKGAFGRSVRLLPEPEFQSILSAGFLGVRDDLGAEDWEVPSYGPGLYDRSRPFEHVSQERPILERMTRRPFREAAFARNVKSAYSARCAMTGLRILNGGGRPEVQAFYGALAGQRANRGVFITTSTFSQQAVDFAGSVERIVLVDGSKLAELMIEYEVGVASRAVRIPKIDSDYFEE